MARPKKDNADYFSHDADMRNDPRIKALRRRHGLSAYAIYNMMLELLTDSDFFQYEWNELSIEIIAGDFDIMPEDLKLIIDYCTETLQLFTIENELIWCNTLRKRFDSLLSKRKRDRSRVIGSENPNSKGEYSKVKESIVNEKKEYIRKGDKSPNPKKRKNFTPPLIEEIKMYCIERGNKVDPQKWFDHYTSNGWMVGKNKMKDWMAAVRTWENNSFGTAQNTKSEKIKPPKTFSTTWSK